MRVSLFATALLQITCLAYAAPTDASGQEKTPGTLRMLASTVKASVKSSVLQAGANVLSQKAQVAGAKANVNTNAGNMASTGNMANTGNMASTGTARPTDPNQALGTDNSSAEPLGDESNMMRR
jgi:hypothetical protein